MSRVPMPGVSLIKLANAGIGISIDRVFGAATRQAVG